MDTEIKHFTFEGEKPGPTLILMGGVHGNEKCGPTALTRLMDMIKSDDVHLTAGKLIIVPIANPEAYKANKRFLERNLNRGVSPKKPEEELCYEDRLNNQLCAILDQGDYLLDIHSYTAEGGPFVFIGCRDAEEKAFAQALDVTHNFVWGWEDAFAEANIPKSESQSTTGYVRTNSHHARALTLECGQHNNPDTVEIALGASLRAMRHVGIVNGHDIEKALSSLPSAKPGQEDVFVKMKSVIRNEPAKLGDAFKHFQPLPSGTLLAFRENKESITAKQDGYAILPNPTAALGAEILYLGINEEPFPSKKKSAANKSTL